jgi:hypothetical protein
LERPRWIPWPKRPVGQAALQRIFFAFEEEVWGPNKELITNLDLR